MSEPTDSELVESARGGDLDAFDDLIRRFHARVAGLCSSLLDNPADVDDAAQEVFIKAFRSLSKFEGKSLFSTWLYQVTMNHCLDIRRKNSRRRTQSLDALVEEQGESLISRLREPEAKQESSDDADLARRVLGAMRDDYREILVLRESQGLAYEEIAATLGCTLDAVKARLRRARRELKERFGHLTTGGGVPASQRPGGAYEPRTT